MNKETRPNTYNRILDAALKLFNEESERNTTTNHIASHLGISPATSTTTSAAKTKSSSSSTAVTAAA